MTPIPMLRVDADHGPPPYEQLRSQLADLIADGAIGAGHRLPAIRQLAGDLGLAAGTVARAYSELECAGLVHSRRGGGTRVADTVPTVSEVERDQRLVEHARVFARHAHLLGTSSRAALDAVAQALAAHV